MKMFVPFAFCTAWFWQVSSNQRRSLSLQEATFLSTHVEDTLIVSNLFENLHQQNAMSFKGDDGFPTMLIAEGFPFFLGKFTRPVKEKIYWHCKSLVELFPTKTMKRSGRNLLKSLRFQCQEYSHNFSKRRLRHTRFIRQTSFQFCFGDFK